MLNTAPPPNVRQSLAQSNMSCGKGAQQGLGGGKAKQKPRGGRRWLSPHPGGGPLYSHLFEDWQAPFPLGQDAWPSISVADPPPTQIPVKHPGAQPPVSSKELSASL